MNAILTNYTFDASAKTITLNDLSEIDIKRVRFIKNLTTNSFIYKFTDALTISSSTNIITFTGSNTGMDDADELSIQYDLTSSIDIQKISGLMNISGVEFIRPSDTNAYLSKDVVCNSDSSPVVLTFTDMANSEGGSGYIVKSRLMTDQSANVSRMRLHLYSIAPTPINDNAQFTLLYADSDKKIGYIDFDALSTEGTGSTAASSLKADLRISFKCASGSKDIYGIYETLDAFSPANAQKYYTELTSDCNF